MFLEKKISNEESSAVAKGDGIAAGTESSTATFADTLFLGHWHHWHKNIFIPGRSL